MGSEKLIWMVISLGLIILAVMIANRATSQELTYCKNYETGEVIVVEAGFPCPYPTVEL